MYQWRATRTKIGVLLQIPTVFYVIVAVAVAVAVAKGSSCFKNTKQKFVILGNQVYAGFVLRRVTNIKVVL